MRRLLELVKSWFSRVKEPTKLPNLLELLDENKLLVPISKLNIKVLSDRDGNETAWLITYENIELTSFDPSRDATEYINSQLRYKDPKFFPYKIGQTYLLIHKVDILKPFSLITIQAEFTDEHGARYYQLLDINTGQLTLYTWWELYHYYHLLLLNVTQGTIRVSK
jgi:hypothetical protein